MKLISQEFQWQGTGLAQTLQWLDDAYHFQHLRLTIYQNSFSLNHLASGMEPWKLKEMGQQKVSLQIAGEFQPCYAKSEYFAGQFVEKNDDQSEGMLPEEHSVTTLRKVLQTSFVGDDMKFVGQKSYAAEELLILHPSGVSSSYHLCHSFD